MIMTAIRGAITARENTKESIGEATRMLLVAVMAANHVEVPEVIDILFTATDDLTAAYPAVAARGLGLTEAGLMCMREMPVEGSLRKCVRLLMHVSQGKSQSQMRHVFLREAASLRPDLASFSIAIDGPSGAGKSTAARKAAALLGMVYVDSGAMYRSVALYNLRRGVDLHDRQLVERSLPFIDIQINHTEHGQRLLLNGDDVTESLRVQEVAEGSSVVAPYEAVRAALTKFQRVLALTGRVVMDGRDIGSTVLPWANIKIYLDASLDERVNRRIHELTEKGIACDPETIRHEIEIRDNRDISRACSPLTKAEDAVYIDSSRLTTDEVVAQIINLVRCGHVGAGG